MTKVLVTDHLRFPLPTSPDKKNLAGIGEAVALQLHQGHLAQHHIGI